ncbi:MAG: hypothetical protein IPK26_00015 [Planctomycetes bacterium]|nr:hypothetical protein [Planctomycetota bacterium]
MLATAEHIGNLEHEAPILRSPQVSVLWAGLRRTNRERSPHGQFEIAGNELFFVGVKEPVAVYEKEPTGHAIEFAPDGTFAVVLREQGKYVFDLVDPSTRTRRRLHEGWTLNHTWLPAPP